MGQWRREADMAGRKEGPCTIPPGEEEDMRRRPVYACHSHFRKEEKKSEGRGYLCYLTGGGGSENRAVEHFQFRFECMWDVSVCPVFACAFHHAIF